MHCNRLTIFFIVFIMSVVTHNESVCAKHFMCFGKDTRGTFSTFGSTLLAVTIIFITIFGKCVYSKNLVSFH